VVVKLCCPDVMYLISSETFASHWWHGQVASEKYCLSEWAQ